MEKQPKPLNVVTTEVHKIVLANVILQWYKGICFAGLTQNWWHIQILCIHSEVNSLQYSAFSEFCFLQKTWFKALNQGSGRFPPCAEYFTSGLHYKSTKQILRRSSPSHALTTATEQNYTAECLNADIAQTLQCRIQQKTYFAEFWLTCYVTSQSLSNQLRKLWMKERKQSEMSLCHYLLGRACSFLM